MKAFLADRSIPAAQLAAQPRAPTTNSTPLCLRLAAPRTHRWHYI